MKKILIWCVRTLLITAIVQVCMPALAVDSSGAFQVEVTVATSPFHGLEPSLALRYDSRLGNGPVGFGWSLQGLSGIARKSSSDGTPRFDDTDRFYLDGNELLACAPDPRSPSARRAACKFPSSTGQPFYALQESFERISLDRGGSAMVWTVWERSGTRRLYQPASDGAAWHLARVEDTMGNAVEYRYSTTPSDEPERLERIEYNGTAVIFHWQPRPDVTSVANGHALLTLRQRLASVEVRVDGQMARTYALSYNQRPLTARSTVASIQEFGRDAIISGDGSVSGTALPASSYRYLSDGAPPANGWLSAPARLAPATLPAAETPTPRYNGRYIDVDHGADCNAFIFQGFTYGDFDGDGRTEPMAILRCPQRGDDRNILRIKAWQFVSNGRTLLGTVDMAMDDDFNDVLPIDERGRRFEVFPADTNGDGRQDLIVLSWRSTSGDLNGPLELMVNVAMSDGRGGLTWATPDFRPTGWITAVIDAINGPRCAVGDFAATRRAALACVFQSGGGTQFIGHAQAQRDGSLLPTAPVVLADSPWPMTPPDVAMVTFPITTGDVNGDGRDDLMVLAPNVAEMAACPLTETHPHCTVHLDLLTGLSDGVGFTFTRQATSWSYDPGAIVTRLFAGDVDGDGKADYLVLNGIGDTLAEIDVARSYRDGAFQLGSQTLPSALSTLGLQVALGDANGDGATDLMILARFDRPVVGCPESWELGVMFRVLSNRDGSFALPDRWDDCSAAPSMPVNSNDFVPSVGSFRAADTNGDGLPDFLLGFQHPEGSTLAIAFVDAPTRAPALDARNWIATDVDGDGRVDLIRIAPGSSQTDVLVAKQLDTSFRVDPVTLPAFDNLAPAAWHVADVDGDGRPDLVHVQCESAAPPGPACDLGIDTFLGRAGGGYAQQPHARLPAAVSGTDGNLASWRVADLDGKGRASLLFLSSARDGVGGVVIHAFTFDGGWQWLAAAGPFNLGSQPPFSTALDDLLNWQVADIDGDGRTDLVHVISNVDSTRVSVLHSLGRNRWELSDTLVPNPPGYSWYLYPEVRSATRWHVLDVNGDGLSDLYRTLPVANGMVVQSLLSLGDGRWSEATFKPDFASSAEARQAAATDDWIALPGGAADLPRLIRIDPGPDSSTQRIVTSLEALPGGLWRVRREEVHDAADPLARVRPAWIGTTLQGPGRRGVFRVDPVRDGGVAAVAISSLVSTQIDDRLTAMRTQAGGSLEIKYAPFADFQPASPADGCLLPAGLDVAIVSTLTVADGRADGPAPTVTHFDYSCPRWLPDLRRFDGWEQILSTTPAAVHRDEGRTLDIYSHSSACGASQRATGPVDSQRHPIGQRDYIEPYPAGDDPWACLPRRRITQVMETPQDLPLTTSMTFEYDHHGNIISMARRAVVNDGTAEGTLTATYAPNVSAWIVATPANVEWHSGSSSHGRLLAQRRYCYDDDTTATCGLPPTSSGLVTRQIDIVDPAAPEGRTTRFGYDEAGNLHSIRNANGHETTIDFDPYHLVYPTRTTDAMGRDAGQVDWDPVLSQPLRIRNGTGAPLVIDYDVLGRAKTVTLPAGGKMTRKYPNAGDPERQSILDTWHDGSGIDTWRRTYFDGLMRPYRLARRASPFGRYERTVNYGDSSSLPWESSTWRCVSWWPWCTPHAAVTEAYHYDALGRFASQTHADGTQIKVARRIEQVGSLAEITDERGDVQGLVHDVLGRLAQATGQVDGTIARTHYRYDATDRMAAAIDPMGNVVSMPRNLVGELVGVEDPDLGIQSMVRDGVGHVLSMTDAKQQTIVQTFDALERLKTRRWPDGRVITLNYDEPDSGASQGRITSMVDSAEASCPERVVRRWRYDAAGQIAELTVCIQGVTQRFGFGHDLLGRLHSITYPDGEEVFYGYDASGRANRLSGIVNHVRFDAADRPRVLHMPNWLRLETTYEPLRDALQSQTARIGGTLVYDEHYTYYENLLLRSVDFIADGTNPTTNLPNGTRQTWHAGYEYDGLGRLTRVTGIGASDFHYDLAGNLDQRSGIGTLSYPPAGPMGCSPDGVTPRACATPHAVMQAGTTTLHYDANGAADTITRADHAERHFTWDADHSPASITDFDGNTARFGYDGFGHRVSTTTDAGSHLWFDALAERTASGELVKHYFLGGRRVASRIGGGDLKWIVADRVDSVRATVDAAGLVGGQTRLEPFGDSGGAGNAVATQFAGHRIEPGVPAIVMGPRLYDPTLGRFMSPDSIVPSLRSTQALNRYTYAYNNPLSYVDPSGHDPVGVYGSFQSSPDASWFGEDFGRLPLYTNLPSPAITLGTPAFNPTQGGGALSPGTGKGVDWADFSLAMGKMSLGYTVGHIEAIVPGLMLRQREAVGTYFDFGRALGNLIGGIEGLGLSAEVLGLSGGGEVLSVGTATPLAVGGVLAASAIGANSTAAVGAAVTQIVTMAMAPKGRSGRSGSEIGTEPTRESQRVPIEKDWKPRAPCRTGCELDAKEIQGHIGGEEKIIRAKPDGSPRLPALGSFRKQALDWFEHRVIVKDGKVYDATTGSQGEAIETYKLHFQYPDFTDFGF